jgi:hypothetical protein
MGWSKHVNMHKKLFLRAFNIMPEDYYKIKWDDVVRMFNPDRWNREQEAKNQNLTKTTKSVITLKEFF